MKTHVHTKVTPALGLLETNKWTLILEKNKNKKAPPPKYKK